MSTAPHKRKLRRLPALFPSILALALAAGCELHDPSESGLLVPKTVDEDPSLPSITIGDAQLHAETFGDPTHPMIMVLHGGPGADYQSLLPLSALADDGYYVVFWDQRGAGLSQRFNASVYSLELYLQDLSDVIEFFSSANEPQPIVFIGHSWGAMYATLYINERGDHGGRIRGAILSEPGAFTRTQLRAYFGRLFGSLEIFGEQLGDVVWMSPFMSSSDHARADYLSKVQTSGGTPAEHLDPENPAPELRFGSVVQSAMLEIAEETDFDWTTNLDRFTAKVLFLRGELNEAAHLEHQTELAEEYPNYELITIPNVGHEMVWERPEEYLEHARAYLEELDLVGGAS